MSEQCVLEALMTERDVARALSMSLASVRRWRSLRQGPKYIKIGASVRYRKPDVLAWLESRTAGGEETGVAVQEAA